MQKLIFGEAVEEMKKLPDKSVDMILADVPYGSTQCEWDAVIPLDSMWEQLKRLIKSNGAICLTASQPFTSILIASNTDMFRYSWYWKKERGTGFITSNRRPLMIIEDIPVFYSKQPRYSPIKKLLDKPYRHVLPKKKGQYQANEELANSMNEDGERKYKYYTHETPHQLLEYSRNTKGSVHPTQKPVALMEYLVKTYSRERETVLDFTCGSGSTIVACANTNRNGIGIDNGHCEKEKVVNGIQIKGLRWVEIARLRLDGKI